MYYSEKFFVVIVFCFGFFFFFQRQALYSYHILQIFFCLILMGGKKYRFVFGWEEEQRVRDFIFCEKTKLVVL